MNALLSVSDKTGIVELAQALHAQGIKLLSTGGTAQLLAQQGLPVTEVASMTGFPEMLDGRVKTLHPRVHGGLLARRDVPAHMQALAEHQIDTIDLLVVNLYPFEATVAKPGCTLEDAIENIDIGGPAMVRSAAKNWKDVVVLTDASQHRGRSVRRPALPWVWRRSTGSASTTAQSATIFRPCGMRPARVRRRRPCCSSSRTSRTAASSRFRICATVKIRTSGLPGTAICTRLRVRW